MTQDGLIKVNEQFKPKHPFVSLPRSQTSSLVGIQSLTLAKHLEYLRNNKFKIEQNKNKSKYLIRRNISGIWKGSKSSKVLEIFYSKLMENLDGQIHEIRRSAVAKP